jgi:hypothetical protein
MTPQALYLLNSPFIVDCAKALVARVHPSTSSDKGETVREMYRLAYQRDPSAGEIQRAVDYIANYPQHDVVMPEVSDWQYGLGDYDPQEKRVEHFTALKFAGQIVKGTRMGKIDESALELNREGGKPSKDKAAIRRWISPQNGHVDIYAELVHLSKTGDGVLCRLVSSRTGLLGEWTAANSSRLTTLNDVEVKKGDTLDFLTECRDDPKNDSFKWAPTITMREAEMPGMKGMAMRWDARSDFMDPATLPKPLGPWEEFAQVLLLSNEFTFVD